ncbi:MULTISPECIES: hypothetical protein [unclassified Ruminococcus]|uniref:hypothetical protein n=1 Tax=unclassified Ruminococcus TaxID=2608920 RepID=UPI002109DBED|nr:MULTISPECIES: hypothetical protein [unclassified Ruminococcus]MCQ4022538.1 hypothetical protein [Ruminococcus sp. zg-924]MCQ4114778.1 hypothetical protein [Ruminococcus sp. zg-921]
MKKKKYIIRAVKVLSLLTAIVLLTAFLQEFVLCHADHNRERIKGFYLEDKDSIDVVLIGASEIYSSYAPGYAYEKFGFTSYPIATQSNIISSYKNQIKAAIEQQHPKLIVVEINGALYGNDKQLEKEANFRNYADNIPLDSNKIELVQGFAPDNQIEHYVPIIKYHSVWNDWPAGLKWNLSIMQDRLRGYNLLKGIKSKSQIFKPREKVYNDTLKNNNQKKALTQKSEAYLRELLEYCKSENLTNVVFTRFPHVVTKKSLSRFMRTNTAADIVAEYGYDFLNFEKNFEDTGLEAPDDFYNLDHLNIYGQKKFTEYLGNILCSKYGVSESILTDSQKAEWDTCAEYYNAYYKYTEDLINKGKVDEIGEECFDMEKIKKFL